MGQVVNLRRARKRQKREREEAAAAENRLAFGRTKAERLLDGGEREKALRDFEGHKIDRNDVE
jgi:hypothetical protein